MLKEGWRRRGFTTGQVAWRLGVKPQEYRELAAGTDFTTWDRICKLYGWPQTFAETTHRVDWFRGGRIRLKVARESGTVGSVEGGL
jgi:hypothetical protein